MKRREKEEEDLGALAIILVSLMHTPSQAGVEAAAHKTSE